MLDAPVRMEDKLAKAKALLLSFQSRQKVTLKKRQSLVVCFKFCVLGYRSRKAVRRLIDLTKSVHRPQHHIRSTRQTKLDLELWMTFL